MSIPVRLTTLLLALLSTAPAVQAHGFLKSPRSRNFVARQQGIEWCHHCLNIKAHSETCGRSFDRNYDFWSSNTFHETTYAAGQQIDVDVELTAHHKGHFTIKACPISSGGVATQACFDNNKLRFISGGGANFDPNYPERAYIPPAPPGTQAADGSGLWNYRYRFQLPSGLSGDRVLLQWHYVTAYCLPAGYRSYNFAWGSLASQYQPWGPPGDCGPLPTEVFTRPGPLPEQFWNCAEVRITGGGGSTPTPPAPTPTPPTSCPAVTSQCGPSRTCASIGFPGQCCSQYGWCGTSSAHCETCCQNGCTGFTSGGTITVQAESYSNSFGVVPENTSDAGGGQNVGNLNTGDWMSYPAVTIPTSGTYMVSYRVAGFGGSLQLERAGGTPVFGTVTIPWTGAWQNWQTVSHTVNLSAGSLPLGIKVTGGGWNINWFTITKV